MMQNTRVDDNPTGPTERGDPFGGRPSEFIISSKVTMSETLIT